MRSTSNVYSFTAKTTLNNHLSIANTFFNYFSFVLIVICLNCTTVFSKQTVLVQELQTKNDKILMRLLQETHNYLEFNRYISPSKFECKAILKNDLTKNIPENTTKIDIQLDYGSVIAINGNQPLVGYQSYDLQQIKRIDSILDLLKGQCLYYSTSTFIYEYCHKEHVRQFDNFHTKQNNVKAQFEDINMGTYNPELYKIRRERKGIKQLTQQQRKITLPEVSNFQTQYNFLVVEDIDNKYGELQLEESQDGNLLYSSIHLAFSDTYLDDSPIIIELTCQQLTPNHTYAQIKNYAMLVHPYVLAYTKKQGKCDKYVNHKKFGDRLPYLEDLSDYPLRAYGKYLYGNVQQVCSRNWAWQRQRGNHQFQNNLQQGSLLFLQLFNEKTNLTQFPYLIIKKVHSLSLIQFQEFIGNSFKTQSSSNKFMNPSTMNLSRFIKNITKCQLLFTRRLNFYSKNQIEITYAKHGIVKVDPPIKIQMGDQYGCICKNYHMNDIKIIDLDLTISKHLWLNYYQTIFYTNTYMLNLPSPLNFQQKFLRDCKPCTCFPFKTNDNIQNIKVDNNKQFTSIMRLTNKSPVFKFNSTNMEHFYILTIKNNGIIKLRTKTIDGIIYTYLLTQGQIIKMIEFQNGTKEIIKQNKYYQNTTFPHDSVYYNFIYIKISRLPNGTYYGGIWKLRDHIYFPRFLLFGQEFVSLERTSGKVQIRILDLERMRKKQSLAIVKYMKRLQQHYKMKEQIKQSKSHLFLDKSYSINYNYVSGKYCDLPVNKFRKTTIFLTCGKSWFQITKLLETSPCQYWIRIETTLLCRQGYKQVLESGQNLFNKRQQDVVINDGVLCLEQGSHYNQAIPYYYFGQYYKS